MIRFVALEDAPLLNYCSNLLFVRTYSTITGLDSRRNQEEPQALLLTPHTHPASLEYGKLLAGFLEHFKCKVQVLSGMGACHYRPDSSPLASDHGKYYGEDEHV